MCAVGSNHAAADPPEFLMSLYFGYVFESALKPSGELDARNALGLVACGFVV